MRSARMATEVELLDVLELGETLSAPERAVLLARAAGSGAEAQTLPLGDRNRLILRLRGQLFGQTIEATDVCPHCHETAGLELSSSDLDAVDEAADGRVEVRRDGYVVTCRPVTSADLLVAGGAPTRAAARQQLLETVVEAKQGDRLVQAATLPLDLVEEIGRRLAEADPLAEISLTLFCEACGGAWEATLDVPEFVWRELRDWGRRLQWEVHVLAGAYGWPEHHIFAVPTRRRQAYLNLVLGG